MAEGLGRVALAFQTAPAGVPARVWQQLSPWLQQLTLNAANKWMPRVTAGFPCQVPIYRSRVPVGPCTNHAVALCDVCGKSVCLDHCRVDQFGDAICYLCIMEAMRRQDATGAVPPPGRRQPGCDAQEEEPSRPRAATAAQVNKAALRAAYRMLGVRSTASDAELNRAYRRALAKHHPDRFTDEREKSAAEEKFKEIQAAFVVITKSRTGAKAAA